MSQELGKKCAKTCVQIFEVGMNCGCIRVWYLMGLHEAMKCLTFLGRSELDMAIPKSIRTTGLPLPLAIILNLLILVFIICCNSHSYVVQLVLCILLHVVDVLPNVTCNIELVINSKNLEDNKCIRAKYYRHTGLF